MRTLDVNTSNPLSDLISNKTFKILADNGLLNKKSLRDHLIRKKFLELKQKRITVIEAIKMIQEDFPYLQFDTIRKIVYQIQK